MKNNKEVVLDGTGLIKLTGGMFLLVAFGFTAGAVLGFGYRADPLPTEPGRATPATAPAPSSAPAAVSAAADTVRCVQAEALPLMEASSVMTAPPPTQAPPTQAAPEQAAPEQAAPERERYVVQLGVFGVEANANRLAADLRRRGYDPLVAAMRARSGQWLKRVSLAVYDSETEADRAASDFSEREGLPAVVVAFGGDGR